ncbi:response regulator [Ectothiorhodospiraceae bacterium BW-2]|nr:response regulator [Ectothiorhodospiraceae bacterium BW-2]
MLVVTEHEQLRSLLKQTLSRLGIQGTQLAADGEEAKNLLAKHPFDLVVIDFYLPKLSGIELLRYLREESESVQAKVLIMTSEGSRKLLNEMVKLGVNGFLVKPFTAKMFAQKIAQVVRMEGLTKGELLAPAAAVAEERAPSLAKSEKPTILLVDDAASNIKLIGNILKEEFNIRATNEGSKVLRVVATPPTPDLILLDVMMPNMSGFELCKRLKANEEWAAIPVIFLTSRTSSADIAQGLEIGAADYIPKPVSPVVLKARVRNQLRISRAHEDRREQLDMLLENARLKGDMAYVTEANPNPLLKDALRALIDLTPDSAVGIVEQSIFQLVDMTLRTIDLYKLEQGKIPLQRERIDLKRVVQHTLRFVERQFESKALRFEFKVADGSDYTMSCDRQLLYGMIMNLLRNAAQAAPDSTRVSLQLQGTEQQLELKIDNQGAIPAALHKRLFERSQGGRTESHPKLGCYLIRQIATLLRGEVQFEIRDAIATTFTLSLPRH